MMQQDRAFVDGIHYVKKGAGNCTVVFVSGTGSSHAIWEEIQDAVQADAVTLAYDRSGLLFSEPAVKKVTNEQVSEELAVLLEKTGCPKPYVLVGHSMAGIYLRPFIQRFNKDIAGIVLLEGAHPLFKEKAPAEVLKALKLPPNWLIRFAVRSGIYKLLYTFRPLSAEIPFGHRLHIIERDNFHRSYKRVLEELDMEAANFKDALQYPSFGDVPLTLVVGGKERGEVGKWVLACQKEMLSLSSNSRLVTALHSGHIIQIWDKELVIEEIRKLV